MLYCENCKVHVRGNPRRCPLCQAALSGVGNSQDEMFPRTKPPFSLHRNLFIRLIAFLSIAAVVICIAIDAILPQSASWPYYVAAAVACTWVCFVSILIRRHNVPKNILWTGVLISLLSIAWDYFTGWHHWALDYVVPSIFVFAMLAVFIIAKAMHQHMEDYLVYLLIDGLFGIIPLVFLLFGWVHVVYPSVICVVVSLLFFAALFLFEWQPLKAEIKKRLHM